MASDKKNLAVRLERIRQLQAQLKQQTQTLADKSKAVVTGIEQVASSGLAMGNRMAQSIHQTSEKAAGFSNKMSEAGILTGETRSRLSGFIETAKQFGQNMESNVGKATNGLDGLKNAGLNVGQVMDSLGEFRGLAEMAGIDTEQFTGLIDSAKQFGEEVTSSLGQAASGMEALKSAGLNTDKVMDALADFRGLAEMTGMNDELTAIEGTVQTILPVVSQTVDQTRQVSNIFKDAAATTGLDKLSENLKTVRSQSGETRKEFRKLGKLTGLLFAKMKRGDGIVALMDHTLKMAKVSNAAAGTVEALGKTVSGALEAPTQYAADFADKIATVAKAANASDAELVQLSDSAKRLGVDTSVGSSQAVAGMQALASAGLKASQIQATMPDMINLAKASGNAGDLSAVGDITAKMMAEFDIVPEKMGKLSDVLATATHSTGVKLGTLSETMRGIGPVARQSGMSLKETAAMAGLLSDMGLKGADAGASLEAMSARLAAPSDAAAATLQRLGVSTQDAGGKMRNTAQVIGDVINATKDMAPEEQLKAMQDVLGQDMAGGLQTATKNGGQSVSGFNEVLNTKEGASADIAGGVDQSIQGGINKLSAVVDSIKLRFGELMGPVKGFADSVVGAAQKVPEMTKAYADFIDNAKSVYQSVQDLKEAYPKLGQNIGKAMRRMRAMGRLSRRFSTRTAGKMIQRLGGIGRAMLRMVPPSALNMLSRFGGGLMRMIPSSVIGVVARFGGALMSMAMSVFPAVVAGIRAIGMAVIMNPLGLLITAIVAIAALIYYYWDPIKKFLGSLWDGFVAGLDWVMEAWDNFSLMDSMKALFDWSPLGFISGVWSKAFDWIKDKLSVVTHAFSSVWNFFTGGDDDEDEEKEKKSAGTKIRQQQASVVRTASANPKIAQVKTANQATEPVNPTLKQAAHAEKAGKVAAKTESVRQKTNSTLKQAAHAEKAGKVAAKTESVRQKTNSTLKQAAHAEKAGKVAAKTESVRQKTKPADRVSKRSSSSKMNKAAKAVNKAANKAVAKVVAKGGKSPAVTHHQLPEKPKSVTLTQAYKETVHQHSVPAGGKRHISSIPEAASGLQRGGPRDHDTMISINQLDIHVQGNDSMDMRDLAGEVRRQFMELMETQKMKYRGGLYDY